MAVAVPQEHPRPAVLKTGFAASLRVTFHQFKPAVSAVGQEGDEVLLNHPDAENAVDALQVGSHTVRGSVI